MEEKKNVEVEEDLVVEDSNKEEGYLEEKPGVFNKIISGLTKHKKKIAIGAALGLATAIGYKIGNIQGNDDDYDNPDLYEYEHITETEANQEPENTDK